MVCYTTHVLFVTLYFISNRDGKSKISVQLNSLFIYLYSVYNVYLRDPESLPNLHPLSSSSSWVPILRPYPMRNVSPLSVKEIWTVLTHSKNNHNLKIENLCTIRLKYFRFTNCRTTSKLYLKGLLYHGGPSLDPPIPISTPSNLKAWHGYMDQLFYTKLYPRILSVLLFYGHLFRLYSLHLLYILLLKFCVSLNDLLNLPFSLSNLSFCYNFL